MCLLSLSLYIFLASKGDSLTLYSTLDSSLQISINQKIFLVLAAFTFLVCMYQGAEVMLFWLPSEWGGIDSDGDFHTLRSSLSITFVIFCGLKFIRFIDSATHEKFFLREIREKSEELEKIIDASIPELNRMKIEYERKIEGIEDELQKESLGPKAKTRQRPYIAFISALWPEKRRIQNYQDLISKIEHMQSRLLNT